MTEQGTVAHHAFSGSDEQALLRRLRSGEDAAFGELFEMHAAAVRRFALGVAQDRSEAEDITAETFFRVLQALRRGAGPRDHIRAYLFTVARRVSWEWHGARRDVPVTDDELTNRAGAGADTNARSAEHTLITTAFTSLPERWRTVLWQTEVEGEQPAVLAPHFGLSANATAALARRARQGLRAAYLQAHLAVNRSSDGCRTVMEKLGGYTAGSVTGSEASRIRSHLGACQSCRATQDELRDVCSSLRAHAGVVALLVPSVVAAGSTAGGGVLASIKGIVAGSKVKVGLALASTAAVGAFGMAVGPVLNDHTTTISLPGRGAAELTIRQQSSQAPQPPLAPLTVPFVVGGQPPAQAASVPSGPVPSPVRAQPRPAAPARPAPVGQKEQAPWHAAPGSQRPRAEGPVTGRPRIDPVPAGGTPSSTRSQPVRAGKDPRWMIVVLYGRGGFGRGGYADSQERRGSSQYSETAERRGPEGRSDGRGERGSGQSGARR
jgi:RNA polymerase sigma factor (sigma-70 family)